MKQSARHVAYGAMAAAMIMVTTAFIKVPGPLGYIHLGDGVLFGMAALLGPLSGLAAGVGSALADLIAGFGVYAPVTFAIKTLMGAIAGRFANGSVLQRICILALCEAIMVAGYFAFETAIYGVAAAAGAVWFNLVQGAFGLTLGVCLTGARVREFAQKQGLRQKDGE